MVHIAVNDRSKEAKAFLEFIKSLSFIKIQEEEKSPYNPEFVAMVKNADKNDKRFSIPTDKLWESL